MSLLSLSSFVAVPAIFAGGMGVAWLRNKM